MDFIPNYDIRLICDGIVEVSRLIDKQRLKYLGHLIRMDEYDPASLQNLIYRWAPEKMETWDWAMSRGRPQARLKDAIDRSLYKIGLVSEIRRTKRKDKTSRKRGRPRKSDLENMISISIVIDWTLVEIAAREKDEWRMLTLSVENYDFSNTSHLFATDTVI